MTQSAAPPPEDPEVRKMAAALWKDLAEWAKSNAGPAAFVALFALLPVEVRCYTSCFRRLVRNARCNTMSHLTADAVFRMRLARNA